MAELAALTAEEFDAAIGDDGAILIDFWAPWCGSCRLLMPTLTKIATELDGDMRFGKVDVDELPALAERLGVMSVPTLVLYRSGKELTRINGVKGKTALLEIIRPHLTAN